MSINALKMCPHQVFFRSCRRGPGAVRRWGLPICVCRVQPRRLLPMQCPILSDRATTPSSTATSSSPHAKKKKHKPYPHAPKLPSNQEKAVLMRRATTVVTPIVVSIPEILGLQLQGTYPWRTNVGRSFKCYPHWQA